MSSAEHPDATAVYTGLRNSGGASTHRVLAYLCAQNRCLLLEIIAVPGGQLLYGWPRYKTSPEYTQEHSTESGRRANTEDGEGHWRVLAMWGPVGHPNLQCDHVPMKVLEDGAVESDLAAGHAEVLVRKDGTRFSVH
jgi:hypothetical protein